MPPVAGALIGGVGSIIGGVISSNAAKSAAKTQAQVAQEQIAANNANRQQITGMEQPNIDRGNAAGSIYGGLLGIGDAAASKTALDTYRGSVGYQDLLNTGLGAVNANAYSRGLGDSGATLKALQAKGMSLADQNQQTYLGNLNNLIQTGNSAIGNVAGVSTATTNANNAALGNAADASSNASLASGAAWSNALKNLINIGSSTASSFGGGAGAGQSGAFPAINMPTTMSAGYGGYNPMSGPTGYFPGWQ
jgi:hypothetical protein